MSCYVGLEGVQAPQGEGDAHLHEPHLQQEADHMHQLAACMHDRASASVAGDYLSNAVTAPAQRVTTYIGVNAAGKQVMTCACSLAVLAVL